MSDSVLLEAHKLVHGDRGKDYGTPKSNFTHTASMINAMFAKKISEPFTPEDVGLLMILVKLSRLANAYKRDSLVDIAGYAETVQMVRDEDGLKTQRIALEDAWGRSA